MARALALCLLALLASACARTHHRHHRHHKQAQSPEPQQSSEGADNDWAPFPPEQIEEMRKAEDDNPFSARPEGGMYDMRGDHFAILDTPEKMDPDYQAKQNLAMVNKANHLRGSTDDDDDDDDE